MIRSHDSLQAGLLALALLGGITDAPAVAAEAEPPSPPATRPDPVGKATRVSLGVFFVDISEIEDAKQTFKVEIYVMVRWKDPRLASAEPLRRMPLAKVWQPALQIINRRALSPVLPEVVQVDRHGNVRYDQRFQGTLAVPLDLHKFPMDDQVLALRIVSPGHSPGEIELVPDERCGRAQDFSITDWEIGPLKCSADPLHTPTGIDLAGFQCTMSAHRLTGAYVYQYVIPLGFIVCMSWACFWMSPEQLGPRQGIAVTAILTIIAYRFVLANELPKVPYLTRFDYLLLGSTTLVFLVLVQVVAAHAMLTGKHPERSRKLDLWARGVFPALFLLLIVGTACL
jgi:hypothetical protein